MSTREPEIFVVAPPTQGTIQNCGSSGGADAGLTEAISKVAVVCPAVNPATQQRSAAVLHGFPGYTRSFADDRPLTAA